ncbi:hypothetical protein GCM10023191_078600 [Actinoallomurus oryzae]|uniref:Uncharacterized protein n=1 Tax=Actinoallomurus oryzae TaxID=502180 RepID=A0ABP8QXH8_9ACTN
MPAALAAAVMLLGYLLTMGYLGAGLWILRRDQGAGPVGAVGGLLGLVRRVAATVLGGYLLLMAVVVGYYQGVARVGGHFVASAFTGCAALIGVALPAFILASYLTVRRKGRLGTPLAHRRRASRPSHPHQGEDVPGPDDPPDRGRPRR